MKYFTMQHCGGLKEALKTCLPIQKRTFTKLIQTGIYKFYGYDERIKAKRYILTNLEKDYGLPAWLLEFETETYYPKND